MGIWNNLPQIITTMGNLLIRLVGVIRERLPEFLGQGLKLIGQLALGIIKAIPGIVAKIPSVIGALVRAFGGLVGQFAGIGGDLIRGLWKGINSVKDWILGKIKGFVGSITKGIKSFFGIKSPSTVMADEVGQWLPKGLAEGIEDNTRPVSQAMEDLAKMTTGTLESQIRVNSIGLGTMDSLMDKVQSVTNINLNGNFEFRNEDDIDYFMEQAELRLIRGEI
jgi:phage-related protein